MAVYFFRLNTVCVWSTGANICYVVRTQYSARYTLLMRRYTSLTKQHLNPTKHTKPSVDGQNDAGDE